MIGLLACFCCFVLFYHKYAFLNETVAYYEYYEL